MRAGCAYENAAEWCGYENACENVRAGCAYENAREYECAYENAAGWCGDNDPRHRATPCAHSWSSCDRVLHPSFGSEECSEWCSYRRFDYDADGAPPDVRFRFVDRDAREDNEHGASLHGVRRLSSAVPIPLYLSLRASAPQACAWRAPGDSA